MIDQVDGEHVSEMGVELGDRGQGCGAGEDGCHAFWSGGEDRVAVGGAEGRGEEVSEEGYFVAGVVGGEGEGKSGLWGGG